MATWTTPLPDNGKTPVAVGDPGHDVMHNEIVDNISEIRTNVDALAAPTVDTLSGAGAFGKTIMKTGSNGDAWLALGVASTVQPVLTASSVAAARTALGATTVGTAVLTAATAAAAATAVGATATGASLLTAASKTAAASAIAAGTQGSGVLNATTSTAAQLAIGITTANNLLASTPTAIADLTAAPTLADFNALLAVLRTRGVLATS